MSRTAMMIMISQLTSFPLHSLTLSMNARTRLIFYLFSCSIDIRSDKAPTSYRRRLYRLFGLYL